MREAIVAGSFYPREEKQLNQLLKNFFSKTRTVKKTNCIIAPHAGYVYSGQTAAFSFNALEKKKNFILLGPNHTGLGEKISIYPNSEWITPLGKISVNEKIAKELSEKIPNASLDEIAHIEEHSLEVQLPFLQYLFKDFSIAPITIASHELNSLKAIGKAIFDCEKKFGEEFGVIASSDFTHFQPKEFAEKKDLAAIEFIKKLDIEGFYNEVVGKNLSICGAVAIIALMQYAKLNGKKKATLLKYDSSATASGDESNVVGYAAIAIE